jgi:hypothetical protein
MLSAGVGVWAKTAIAATKWVTRTFIMGQYTSPYKRIREAVDRGRAVRTGGPGALEARPDANRDHCDFKTFADHNGKSVWKQIDLKARRMPTDA